MTEKQKIKRREQRKKSWGKKYHNIQRRCHYHKHHYCEKGIKNYLSLTDIKDLWIRDNADKMKEPVIHRKNNKKDYTINNCEFIEKEYHKGKSKK